MPSESADNNLVESYRDAYRRANGYDVEARTEDGKFYIRIVAVDCELVRSREDFALMRDALLARAEEIGQ